MKRLVALFLWALLSWGQAAHAQEMNVEFTHWTKRYDHCVLGDCLEADEVSLLKGATVLASLQLGLESVFEDIAPRRVDLGNNDVGFLTVRSYLDRGAALVLLGVSGNNVQIVSESDPIGLPHRWLNPIGAADFDGDGVIEFAAVITPHIGGILTLYEQHGVRLVVDGRVQGVSNHVMGSRELDLAEMIDWNLDGVLDIVVPSANRQSLKVISFAGKVDKVLAEIPAPHAIIGPIVGKGRTLKIGLQGQVWTVPMGEK